MLLDLSTLADRIETILRQREAALRLEQAVYGLDSLDEISLQEVLAEGLKAYAEVGREVHYPSTVGRKLSNRPRCDLVLSPIGYPLRLDSRPPTLFDPPDQCEPEGALWLEVKCAAQFRAPDVRHSGYGGQWRTGVVEDLKKMEAEPRIHAAALLLLVFVESEVILQKDLELFENLLIQKEVLAGFRQVRVIPILDRMGNRLCAAAIWPTVQRGG
jgi:hypothetical protein